LENRKSRHPERMERTHRAAISPSRGRVMVITVGAQRLLRNHPGPGPGTLKLLVSSLRDRYIIVLAGESTRKRQSRGLRDGPPVAAHRFRGLSKAPRARRPEISSRLLCNPV
jgi:hypothetical protein